VEIYGTEGYIRFGYPPLQLQHGRRAGGGRVRVRRFVFPVYQVLERLRGWEWGLVETLSRELRAFAAAIRDGSPPSASGRDGLEAVRIALSAVRL
jgi:predicted dehydrogenase